MTTFPVKNVNTTNDEKPSPSKNLTDAVVNAIEPITFKTPEVMIPGKTNEPTEDYNDIQLSVFDTESQKRGKLEMFIGKSLAAVLANHYPNRNWNIGVDLGGGVVIVQCPDISTTAGYHISLQRSMDDIRGMLPRIGGEILERASVSRDRKFDQGDMETLNRDVKGNVVSEDLLAPEEKHIKRHRASEENKIKKLMVEGKIVSEK